ncbi:metallophosphoesterase [Frankia sp. QA3]|uniref:metallophosphoesterase family protein n=1 Tax=Frankia sp. QA3 TaxID=710111 RepID=UPI000269C68E|nr:metallophosphoesterase [Frankia sp. QA3]EIV94456.1 putative phosphoesterase, ICC [Frankia sp. QA3]
MMRIAAVGDIHLGTDSGGTFAPVIRGLAGRADVLLLAGDLTQHGLPAEAEVVAAEVAGAQLPVVAVLGNHDYHGNAEREIAGILTDAGVTVLEGTGTVLDIDGARLGVAGVKGFGGGFAGASGTDFGEPLMKAFVRHTKETAARLRHALEALDCDIRVALTHYAPIPDTLIGERAEIYPFLGSYHLAEAMDAGGASLALHGHAHAGSERGSTAGGVPVRNVARPVIGKPCAFYAVGAGAAVEGARMAAPSPAPAVDLAAPTAR